MKKDKWKKRKPGNHNIQFDWTEIMARVSDESGTSILLEGKESAARKDPPEKSKKGKNTAVKAYIARGEEELPKSEDEHCSVQATEIVIDDDTVDVASKGQCKEQLTNKVVNPVDGKEARSSIMQNDSHGDKRKFGKFKKRILVSTFKADANVVIPKNR